MDENKKIYQDCKFIEETRHNNIKSILNWIIPDFKIGKNQYIFAIFYQKIYLIFFNV